MGEKSVSFRTHLQSNTSDLLSAADVDCIYTVRLVIGLVSQLAAYTEEGRALSPSVFVCNSVSNLVRMSGAGEAVELSELVPTETAALRILKAAAPLCAGNWRIYVERSRDGKECRYGVFCGSNDPSSFTIDEAVLGEAAKGYPVIRVAQTVTNKVEVRTSAGGAVEFRFNDDTDVVSLDDRTKVTSLARAAGSGVEPHDPTFIGFLDRVLSTAIRDSHGTLIAVTKNSEDALPVQLSDAVTLKPALDLHSRYRLHFEESKTAVSVSRLQAASELLAGFVNCDGITVLTPDGRVIAYRAFIKAADPEMPSAGGARTRAFASLSALVGEKLSAAFFRSQDGRMEFTSLGEC